MKRDRALRARYSERSSRVSSGVPFMNLVRRKSGPNCTQKCPFCGALSTGTGSLQGSRTSRCGQLADVGFPRRYPTTTRFTPSNRSSIMSAISTALSVPPVNDSTGGATCAMSVDSCNASVARSV